MLAIILFNSIYYIFSKYGTSLENTLLHFSGLTFIFLKFLSVVILQLESDNSNIISLYGSISVGFLSGIFLGGSNYHCTLDIVFEKKTL